MRLDLTAEGGVASRPVWRFYTANRAAAAAELSSQTDAVINAVAAYMTLGSHGYQRKTAAMAEAAFNVMIDPNAYTINARQYLGPEEDPDRDGVTNLEEWEAALVANPGDPQAALAEFAAAAIDPESDETPGAKRLGGVSHSKSSEGPEDCGCQFCAPPAANIVFDPYIGPTYSADISASVGCMEGEVDRFGGPNAIPRGQEIGVAAFAVEGRHFAFWLAPGTLLDRSLKDADTFVNVASTTVTPVTYSDKTTLTLGTLDGTASGDGVSLVYEDEETQTRVYEGP